MAGWKPGSFLFLSFVRRWEPTTGRSLTFLRHARRDSLSIDELKLRKARARVYPAKVQVGIAAAVVAKVSVPQGSGGLLEVHGDGINSQIGLVLQVHVART